jgi:hypothetical protein
VSRRPATLMNSESFVEPESDPDLIAFFDSLVWEDWEPKPVVQRDPVTRPLRVKVKAPESVLDNPSTATSQVLPEIDADLLSVLQAWPKLSPKAKGTILGLARATTP